MRSSVCCALLAAALWSACADPVDKAAKQRIFSPEDPPKVVSSAAEKLPPDAVADDPRVARRVLEMGAAEATERIGPHEYTAAVTFEWSGADAGTHLSEKRTLVAGRGGVNGDFDARTQNDRDQGLEVLRVGGQVFAKDLYGKFRQRLRDRGMAERSREDVYGTLKDFESIFDHRLKLSPKGEASYEGRRAMRFDVSLSPQEGEGAATKLPSPQYARGGMDEGSRRRHAFFEKRRVKSISGELWVDQETSVVVKAHLDGRLEVPGPSRARTAALLHMSLDAALKNIDKPVALKPPQDFLPDQDKPAGIADALDRFGIPRGGHADAGTDTELPDEEP